MSNQSYLVNEIQSFKVLPHSYASRLNDTLELINNGKTPSYSLKRCRMVGDFIEFCDRENLVINSGVDVALCFSAWQEEHFSGSKKLASETLVSYARALRITLLKLSHKSVQGLPEESSIPLVRRLSTTVYSESSNSKTKILGGFDLPVDENKQSVTLALEDDIDTFIENLAIKMRKHRDVIYKISVKYLQCALSRFEFAQQAKAQITKEKFQKNANLQHPTQKCIGGGQHLSLFSLSLRDGECGYSNLMAYINHCHNGLIDRKFPGGNNHLYRFTNNQFELREHFGLSSISAVAASNIIIIESGINIDSLRNISLTAQGALSNCFEANTQGFRIGYKKARAKAHKSRNLKHLNLDDTHISKAFDYLMLVTSHHREMLEGKVKQRLFIHDSTTDSGQPNIISDTAFKYGFKRLLIAAREHLAIDPDWCKDVTTECIDEVLAHSPNAKALRATEGVIRWFDSGGNPSVAANYLGNSEAVAIKNYLPKELQLAVYNQRIKRFHNVLIASATNGEVYQIKALDLKDEKELSEYLSKLDKRIPQWRTAIQALSTDFPVIKDKNRKVTLDLCPENIAIMKACYVKQSERDTNGIMITDGISDLSQVYQGIITYLKKNPDRRLSRTVLKGEKLYDNKTHGYQAIKINKEVVKVAK